MRNLLSFLIGTLYLVLTVAHADAFTLTSSAFFNQDAVPVLYTCDGKNTSPPIEWTGIPANTKTLALILSDIDAPGGIFYHWVMYNIPKATSGLPEGVTQLPPGTVIGKNSWNNVGYKGPCPPKGKIHHYIFSLYALDTQLPLTADADAPSVLAAMQNHVIGVTDLKATYSH